MTIQSLARTIAKARHSTDAMWANYMGAAEAAWREVVEECARIVDDVPSSDPLLNDAAAAIRALIAQPDGAQIK